jgi:DUF1680 family protein
MHTTFPEKPDVQMQLLLEKPIRTKIRIRVPSWIAEPMPILVNNKLQTTGKAGEYVTLDRTWNNKDEIRFTLPMKLRMTKYTGIERGFENAYAIEYGPIMLAVITDYAKSGKGLIRFQMTADEFVQKLKPIKDKPLHFSVDDPQSAEVRVIPYFDVKGELLNKFTCFPNFKP